MSSILLVDDDADWRGLWRAVLEGAGHDVRESGNGADALRSLSNGSVDLVLLDLTMPETSGWDVLTDMRGRDGSAPPVVVVTSHAEESSELRARELGAAAYVAKPVSADDLLGLVNRIIAS